MRLERRVHDLLGAEGVLEHLRGRGKGAFRIAAPQMEVERDIGRAPSGQMLQVGEGAGRSERIVDMHRRARRLDLVIDGRQRVIFGGDRAAPLLRRLRRLGEDDGNRLADMPHLALGEDRLVVKGRAVIGIGDDGADFGGGDDSEDAPRRPRRRRIDRADAGVRHGAPEDLAVQHAGQAQIVDIFGGAGDLGARLQPRHRASDLAGGRRAHPATSAARISARRTTTPARCFL